MSDMNGNPHYGMTQRWNGKEMSEIEVSLMSAHATLALACEQRTANLFAYWNVMTAGDDEWADTPFQREMDSIQCDIRVRMGLAPEIAK